ncbi:chromosome 6 open reading frame 106, isoform A, putative [Pediculus humanus corporis]|uniref:Chromosome 6 open reading frame 106, isoform A, putative n=1 Tax=Pediculus humanus subsp. corporis TaxID=121224 RepID=E0VDQ2_PEDHC|nr:chromosome 6 open reading frame 106, isoform A, putative [Pediculus humanus corporis]EEB11508.1 chromosome 6 open reading frame 106, isoform A, putative [Pediculus humanus corporis]
MDVDNEIDQTLLHQFSCMGTTDKDDLVKQLQAIVGHQINSNTAAFFLEMNNWNLQAAVGSYFDINSSHKLPSMILTKDVAVAKGDGISPNTKFIKSWYIQNNGNELWPAGCYLQFTGGVCMSHQEKIPVVPIAPGCCTCLSIEMISPSEPGIYQSKWRMCTSSGSYFGDVIWVILTVVDNNELEGLTQQLSHLSDLGSPPRTQGSQINPFNSFESFLPVSFL